MNQQTPPPPALDKIRVDQQLIADMVADGSRVLDIGAGDGALLAYLVHFKGVDGRGIEIDHDGVTACVSHGLAVIQGDAESGFAGLSRRQFRLRNLEPDAASHARRTQVTAAIAAHWPPCRRQLPTISDIGVCVGNCWRMGACR